jgi:hypothetical protein
MTELHELPNKCLEYGPQSAMERALLEEFLKKRGYSLETLDRLPEREKRAVMTEACNYASLKLAQVESTAHFRETIRLPE